LATRRLRPKKGGLNDRPIEPARDERFFTRLGRFHEADSCDIGVLMADDLFGSGFGVFGKLFGDGDVDHY
jgi:hypothetical protein